MGHWWRGTGGEKVVVRRAVELWDLEAEEWTAAAAEPMMAQSSALSRSWSWTVCDDIIDRSSSSSGR